MHQQANSNNIKIHIGAPADVSNKPEEIRLNLFFYRIEPSGFQANSHPNEPWRMRMFVLVSCMTALADDQGVEDLRLLAADGGIVACTLPGGPRGHYDGHLRAVHDGGGSLLFVADHFLRGSPDAFLLFVGAMGKSAQLFLHTWLPDAMEGPTPVSALIHAATMVTAGVFLVCRMSPLYEVAPETKTFIVYIGATTAFFAATVGLVQNDIKRVIAYSTCSQLGYMFVAAGVGVYSVAMFHLLTHAFFKAMLFLGAGSVIHAMHHEQDMRNYGNLRKKIPLTFYAMLIGTLAITGVGIPFTMFGFAGFFSKDAIIESAYAGTQGGYAFWMLVIAALFTSFYSWRLMFLTFWGKPRWEQSEHIQHAVHDDHGHGEHALLHKLEVLRDRLDGSGVLLGADAAFLLGAEIERGGSAGNGPCAGQRTCRGQGHEAAARQGR